MCRSADEQTRKNSAGNDLTSHLIPLFIWRATVSRPQFFVPRTNSFLGRVVSNQLSGCSFQTRLSMTMAEMPGRSSVSTISYLYDAAKPDLSNTFRGNLLYVRGFSTSPLNSRWPARHSRVFFQLKLISEALDLQGDSEE